ncbi:MAG: class I SAM-dependent methyltransferase [Bryobacterales bacterium]
MDALTSQKWDRAAGRYDLFSAGAEKRWAEAKQKFFAPMRGNVLFLAIGTGLDFQFFPPGQDIVALDISPEMIERARPRAAAYKGRIELRLLDVHELDAEEAFDQVFTACTFCSVPDPVNGLRRLHRALKPGGELRMFEHTGSRWFPFSMMLHLMTPISRLSGPELNRPTVANVAKAGFTVREVDNLYLDIVKTITAVK